MAALGARSLLQRVPRTQARRRPLLGDLRGRGVVHREPVRHPRVRVAGLRDVQLAQRLDQPRHHQGLQQVLLRHEARQRAARKQKRLLARGVLDGGAGVRHVAQRVDAELRADGFRVQLARDVRVRGAHALAPRAHGVHLGEHRHHHRAARQELRRRPERVRAFQVLVESPRAGGRQPLLRPAHDVEPIVLRGAEHAVGQAGQHGVGLHDAHGLLHGVRCARVGAGTARARRLLSSAESARSSSSDASRQRLVRQLKSETQSAPFSPSGKRRGRRTVHEAPRCRHVDNGDIGGEARDVAAAAMGN